MVQRHIIASFLLSALYTTRSCFSYCGFFGRSYSQKWLKLERPVLNMKYFAAGRSALKIGQEIWNPYYLERNKKTDSFLVKLIGNKRFHMVFYGTISWKWFSSLYNVRRKLQIIECTDTSMLFCFLDGSCIQVERFRRKFDLSCRNLHTWELGCVSRIKRTIR